MTDIRLEESKRVSLVVAVRCGSRRWWSEKWPAAGSDEGGREKLTSEARVFVGVKWGIF